MDAQIVPLADVRNLLSASNLAVASTIAASLLGALLGLRNSSTNNHSPPSPKPHLIVGHTFQVPTERTWRYFDDLSKKLGPIFRLSLAGDEIVVLTEPEDVEELVSRYVPHLLIPLLTCHSWNVDRTTTLHGNL